MLSQATENGMFVPKVKYKYSHDYFKEHSTLDLFVFGWMSAAHLRN
jgi:hypothetical protein